MNKIRQFKEDEEEKICHLYKTEGQTLTFIRQIFHCRTEAIKNVLEKHNIPIKRSNLSKNRLLKEDFFEIINTEEKAYFLGLMFADGAVVLDASEKRSPSISLSLKLSDIQLIQEFRTLLCMGGRITYDKRKNKESAILSFRSKKMAEDLSKYGIVPNKTYKTKHLPEVPQEFLKDFLRGLLDGDGSLYLGGTNKDKLYVNFCSCHKSICEEFREKIHSLIINKNTSVIKNYSKVSTAYHVHFYKQSTVKQLVTALYKDSIVSLARKYSLARNFFEGNNEEDIVYSDH